MRTRWRAALYPTVIAMAMAFPAVAGGEKIPVANEGGIRNAWMLAEGVKLVAPEYPQAFVARRDTVCVGVGYLLNPDGSTSDFTLVKAWNSASGAAEPEEGYWATFAEAAAAALKQWRFQPRPEVTAAQPVYTVATFVFGGDTATMRGHCAVPNLAQRLRELRTGNHRRIAGSDILERLELGLPAANGSDPRYGNVR